MPRPPDPLVGDGLLLVDKSAGMTSHDVVGACRRICGTRKVGHAGTLDPMATGLLLVGVNRATRLLTFLVGCDKTYEATIRLGVSTVTDDADGEVTARADAGHLSDADIAAAVAGLTGDIEQVPSSVSAIKIDGVRSYTRVRDGEDVALAARPVRVSRFDVRARRDGVFAAGETSAAEAGAAVEIGRVDLDVVVEVSSGTYVRALARDLGAALGVGGHLTALRRTRVGGFDVAGAHLLPDLEAARAGAPDGESGLPLLRPADAMAVSMPARTLDDDSAWRLAHGVRIPSERPGRELVAAYDGSGRLIGIVDESEELVRIKTVITNDW